MVSPSRTPTTLPEKSAAKTLVGMSKAASSRNSVLCRTMVVAKGLQITIALRVDEELECGSAHRIFQIVGEEVQPGERK
jgi:hypothetical protein